MVVLYIIVGYQKCEIKVVSETVSLSRGRN